MLITHSAEPSKVVEEIQKVLKDMDLEHTIAWQPSSSLFVSKSGSNGLRPISFSVLPRHIALADLTAAIGRLHRNFKLFGGALE